MSAYILAMAVLGLAFLAGAILPPLLKKTPVSLPMVYVAAGLALPWVWPGSLRFDPVRHGALTERLAELAVIVSLMSAGLKLDRPVGWRSWRSTWGLLAVTMPLCIIAMAGGGVFIVGLPLAAAVLLAAVIAPTDPVLAAEVQVGPPGQEREQQVPFALTSEAGLNDGLAFPFVNLAIVLAATGLAGDGMARWFGVDVVWKIVVGIVCGAVIGRGAAVLVFRLVPPNPIGDGFLALALTLVAYAATELIHGYGFIGVFIAAMVFRRYERDHEYHATLHAFSEQVERMLMAVILLLFGMAITHGLLGALNWPAAMLALGFLLVVRPLSGLLGLTGTDIAGRHRIVIAAFGIRGIGTFYYLAHGLNKSDMPEPQARLLWAIAGFIVLLSIFAHGISSSFLTSDSKGAETGPSSQSDRTEQEASSEQDYSTP